MKKIAQISRSLMDVAHGETFTLPAAPKFGPMFANVILYEAAKRFDQLLDPTRLLADSDDVIVAAFEAVRDGLSPDSFLADPSLSRRLAKECVRRGLRAPESAINLRLLTLRKRTGGRRFVDTKSPTRSRHLIEEYGPGVEVAMRLAKFRFGASVDDILAFPKVGEAFDRICSDIAPGGESRDYRLCALQIRKSRHFSKEFFAFEEADKLDPKWLAKRWIDLGSVDAAQKFDVPERGGLIELATEDQSLYILRTHELPTSIRRTFAPQRVKRLLTNGMMGDINYKSTTLRLISNREMPTATPLNWELKLIAERDPLFNWPIHEERAVA